MNNENKNINESTIVTNRYIKEKLPHDFNVDDIGGIDLNEAEKIANEDIVLLSERDLLADLEEFNLEPLDDYDEVIQDEKEELPVASTVVSETVSPEIVDVRQTTKEKETEKPAEHEETIIHAEQKSAKQKIEDKYKERVESDQKGKDAIIEYFSDFIDFYNQEDLVTIQKPVKREIEVEKPAIEEVKVEEKQVEEREPKAEERSVPEIVHKEKIDIKALQKEDEKQKVDEDHALIIEEFQDDGIRVQVKDVPDIIDELPTLEAVDEEYSEFLDDDIDFVHTAIVQDDYINYIRNIDQYSDTTVSRTTPKAIEIFGFTLSEIEEMQDSLFQQDFKDVEFDAALHPLKIGLEKTKGILAEHKDITYIIPHRDSLNNSEKESIEMDITSNTALVYVEDVIEIQGLLGKDDSDLDLVHNDKIIEKEEYTKSITKSDDQVIKSEELFDITDKVIIIEDELDVDRFVREFPINKQTDIQKLLKYLDGLFEKLPRSTLKKFVDSEYFDLYIKVLTKMGV